MAALTDCYGRQITYLRVSVTDRCNLRCAYCMPRGGVPALDHDEILRYEEIAELASVASTLGIRRFRITGGEPLVRKDLVELARSLGDIAGTEGVALTTNGVLLAEHAGELKEAGVSRINVSLDTLDARKFERLTGQAFHRRVVAGIEEAIRVGFSPLKINVVVMRGLNETEVVGFVRLTERWPVEIRFIEYMPIAVRPTELSFVPMSEVRLAIQRLFSLEEEPWSGTGGPATVYRVPATGGRVGFIAPVSNEFCAKCNRIRLTADGHLKSCLLSPSEFDVKTPLRSGASRAELAELFRRAALAKPPHHNLTPDVSVPGRTMSQVGG